MMSGKKVYVGNGEYCYTEPCSRHDRRTSAELMRRAYDCAASNDAAGYLKFKELSAQEAKKEEKATHLRAVPTPPSSGSAPIMTAADRRERAQRALAAIKNDLNSYDAKETLRNGERIVKFHRDIGLPRYFRKPTGVAGVRYSNHAIDEAENDRYGRIPVFSRIDFDKMEVIEVKYSQDTGKVSRMLVRSTDGENNVCLVLQPPAGPRQPWRVITNWYNESGDDHHTLNRSRYNVPNQGMKVAA